MTWTDDDRQVLHAMFVAEAAEQLAAMEQGLVALEQQPDDTESLETVFRAVHTLKGNAGSMQFTAVAELAHAAEDVLDRLRTHELAAGAAVISLLLATVDALRETLDETLGGTEPSPRTALMERLATAAAQAADAAGRTVALEAGPLPTDGQPATARTLRVDVLRLDRLLDASGEMVVAQGRLERLLHQVPAELRASLIEAHQESARIGRNLQDEILRVRMVPIGPAFRQQARTLRDAAQACGKQVRLSIEGAEVEVDTAVVERLRGPLTHMIRNAVDHGIEAASVRETSGKDARGTVTLRARHETGGVVIELRDDGAGLDRARIAARARETGLAAAPEAMADADLFRLVFEPGFSTAEVVTGISGRGIGMDVVRQDVLAVRGTVDVDSVAGAGTTVTIRVPLTVTIIQGFLVQAGPETYVLPLESLIECADLPASEKDRGHATGTVDLRGQLVPYVRLRDVFALGAQTGGRREALVVVHHQGRKAALAVDTLLGETQAVIKPLGGFLKSLPGVSGSTILGDGRAALILDVPALLRAATATAGRGDDVPHLPGPATSPFTSNGATR